MKLGDKVLVTNVESPAAGHTGTVVAVDPANTSFDYHVKLEVGAIYGFYASELKPAE